MNTGAAAAAASAAAAGPGPGAASAATLVFTRTGAEQRWLNTNTVQRKLGDMNKTSF